MARKGGACVVCRKWFGREVMLDVRCEAHRSGHVACYGCYRFLREMKLVEILPKKKGRAGSRLTLSACPNDAAVRLAVLMSMETK